MLVLNAMRTNIAVATLHLFRANDSAYSLFGQENAIKADRPINHLADQSPYVSMRQISYAHAAFYAGHVVFQIPCAWTTTKFPSNRLFCFAAFISSALNILIPLSVNGKLMV